ncbi:MAG: amidohydrolase family protein, partial [Acetobacteraceae bacterium]|nr:amidohydrolase family protein [Acetobacteraceae bacterium]
NVRGIRQILNVHPDPLYDYVGRHFMREPAWRDGMRVLAGCPNIAAKISGLGMTDHSWSVESIRPYVLETIDAFGVGRCMFASNFPVDRLYGSYGAIWAAFAETIRGGSEAEKVALFRENAERIYRI